MRKAVLMQKCYRLLKTVHGNRMCSTVLLLQEMKREQMVEGSDAWGNKGHHTTAIFHTYLLIFLAHSFLIFCSWWEILVTCCQLLNIWASNYCTLSSLVSSWGLLLLSQAWSKQIVIGKAMVSSVENFEIYTPSHLRMHSHENHKNLTHMQYVRLYVIVVCR